MSKYQKGQILKVLGGFEYGCMGTGDSSIGKLFEVITDEDTTPYDTISGFVPSLHKKEEYVLLRNLKTKELICLNSDFEAEVIEFSIGEEVEVVNKTWLSSYDIGDIVKVVKVRDYNLELEKVSDGYTQTLPIKDVSKIDKTKKNILTINEDNEVTYYENGTEFKVKIEEDVLQGFLEEIKPVVPHLESPYGKGSYGILGEATKLKDSLDAPLFIGDIIEIYRNGFKVGTCVIAKGDDQHGAFVYGWKTSMSELAMESNSFNEDVKLRKIKSFDELENGYAIGGVTVVREEK